MVWESEKTENGTRIKQNLNFFSKSVIILSVLKCVLFVMIYNVYSYDAIVLKPKNINEKYFSLNIKFKSQYTDFQEFQTLLWRIL